MKTKSKRGRPVQKPLTIGVDAAILGRQDSRVQAGVYSVARNLLYTLARMDKKNTYILYSFSRIPDELMHEFGSSMRNVVLPRWGWFRLWLPLALKLRQPDVFFALSQTLPKAAPPSVGIIYDIAFEQYPQGFAATRARLQKNSRSLINRARRVVTISHATKADVQQTYGVDAWRICVAYPGVSRVFRQAQTRFVGDHPYFLFVGSLRKSKNIPLLLEAFAQFLKKTDAPYQLYLVGSDFWFDKQITKTIDKLRIANSVQIQGVVPEDKLVALYRGATAVVLPSIAEGFGLPVVEAMASGTPVIAARIPALVEVVGSAGVLVDPYNPDELSHALVHIAHDRRLRKRLRQAGLQRAKQFSWKRFAKTVLQEIKTVAYA